MEDRFDLGKKAGIVGIGANVLLFGVKLAASIISGSLSIITDAVNNLTDALSSVLVLVGYHIASKPADKEHPYGHARMEYISSLLIAVIVTFLGFEFFRESVGSLLGEGEYERLSGLVPTCVGNPLLSGFRPVHLSSYSERPLRSNPV